MADDISKRAQEAFMNEEYELSLQLYTEAIDANDTQPEYFTNRAAVYAKLGNYSAAIMDTSSALQMNPVLIVAHFRQGVYYWHMEDYMAANTAFQRAKQLGDTSAPLGIWLAKCATKLGSAVANAPVPLLSASVVNEPSATSSGNEPSATSSGLVPSRIRHDWYQTEKKVVIDVIIKKVKKEDVSVAFSSVNVAVTIRGLPGGGEYNLDLDLCYEIIPEESKYTVLGTKVEVSLAKKSMVRWPGLEGSGLEPSAATAVRMQSADTISVDKKKNKTNGAPWLSRSRRTKRKKNLRGTPLSTSSSKTFTATRVTKPNAR